MYSSLKRVIRFPSTIFPIQNSRVVSLSALACATDFFVDQFSEQVIYILEWLGGSK
jgi:hypothetical protein